MWRGAQVWAEPSSGENSAEDPQTTDTAILPPRQQCWVSDIRDAQHRTFIHEVSLAIAIAAFEQSYKNILIDINDKDRQGLRDWQLPFKIFAMMQHNC